MLPTKAPLFQLIAARLGWLGQRQAILNQNIANADTPDFQPRDLRPQDFERLLGQRVAQPPPLPIVRTHGGHMGGHPTARVGLDGKVQETQYEVAPDGNAVVLEEQMAKATETALDFQLTSNLYRKYLGMLRTALGHQA